VQKKLVNMKKRVPTLSEFINEAKSAPKRFDVTVSEINWKDAKNGDYITDGPGWASEIAKITDKQNGKLKVVASNTKTPVGTEININPIKSDSPIFIITSDVSKLVKE